MGIGVWQATIVDDAGSVIPAASVQVKIAGSGAFAALWSNKAGTATLANPFAADGNGFARFYIADNVEYQITVTSGAFTRVWEDVLIPAVLDSATLATMLGDQTPAEDAAGVTPINKLLPEGHWNRYFNGGAGATNDSVGVLNTLKVGFQGVKIFWGVATKFAIDAGLVLTEANGNIPPVMEGYGVEFIARAGSSGRFMQVLNPHSKWRNFMWIGTFNFNCNGLCSCGLTIKGCQDSAFVGMFGGSGSVGAVGTAANIEFITDANYGIYYNVFMGFRGGDQQADGSTGVGIKQTNIDGVNRMNGNLHLGAKASWNVGAGRQVDRNTDTWVGSVFEKNNGPGTKLVRTAQITDLGGYSEHNDQNYADNVTVGYTGDGTADVSMEFTVNSNRVYLFGGNHAGVLLNYDLAVGHVLFPGSAGGIAIWPDGIGISGATVVPNGIGFDNDVDAAFKVGGANKLRWDHTDDYWQVHVEMRTQNGVKSGSIGSAVDAAAVTDETSTTKGHLFPRMTTTQRDAIASPPNGLVIYNSTVGEFQGRAAGTWKNL